MSAEFKGMVDLAGWVTASTGGFILLNSSSFLLNVATSRFAFIYRPAVTGVIQRVRLWVQLNSGTVQRSQVRCRIYQSNATYTGPGTAVSTEIGLSGTGNLPAGGAYEMFDFSAQNLTLNDGHPYWFVIRNSNATPASNNFTLVYCSTPGSSHGSGTQASWYSTTWSLPSPAVGALFVTSTGVEGLSYGAMSTMAILTTGPQHFVGVRFTTPPGQRLNLAGAYMVIYIGTGTTQKPDLIYRLYDVTAGNVLVVQKIVPFGLQQCIFDQPVMLEPSNTYALCVARSTSMGGPTDTIALQGLYIQNIAENLSPLPMQCRAVESTDDGGTWTVYTDRYLPYRLFLHYYEPVVGFHAPPGYLIYA